MTVKGKTLPKPVAAILKAWLEFKPKLPLAYYVADLKARRRR
jgi:hypothetical protein